jgi:hypothetical protein
VPRFLTWRLPFAIETSIATGISILLAAILAMQSNLFDMPWCLLSAFACAQRDERSNLRESFIIAIQLSFALCLATVIVLLLSSKMAIFAAVSVALLVMGQGLLFYPKSKLVFIFAVFTLGLFCANVPELKWQLLSIFAGAFLTVSINALLFSQPFSTQLQLSLPPLITEAHAYLLAIADAIFLGQGVFTSLKNAEKKMQQMMANVYPNWVFALGFNPNLRGGIRYFMLLFDRLVSGFDTLNTLSLRDINRELLDELTEELRTVIHQNGELLLALRAYFLTNTLSVIPDNLTQDIEKLEKKLKSLVPSHLELLDISPDYLALTAIVVELKEERQWLLQLLNALPTTS